MNQEASAKHVMRCTSCRRRIEAEKHWVKFLCPACQKSDIIRCEKCKGLEVKYVCEKCGFEGP